MPFLGIGAGAFIGLLRPGDPHARRAASMFFASSLLVALDPRLVPDWLGRAREELAAFGGIVALPASVLWFFLLYPQRSLVDRRAPWLKWLLPGTLLALYLLVIVAYHASAARGNPLADWLLAVLPRAGPGTLPNRLIFVTISVTYAAAMTALGLHSGQATSADEQRRFRLLFVGVSCGTAPLLLLVLNRRLGWDLPMGAQALLVLVLGVFPLSFTYVVVTHRVFGLPVLLRRGLQHALVSRGFLVGAGALIFWMLFAVVRRLVAGGAFERGPAGSLLTAGVTLASVFGLQALNRRVLPLIDRRFFREAYDSRQILLGLSRVVRRLSGEPERMLATVGEQLRSALHPGGTTLYLATTLEWPRLGPVPGLEPVTLEGLGVFRPVQPAGAPSVPRARLSPEATSRVAAALADDELHAISLPPVEADSGFVSASLVVPLRGGDGRDRARGPGAPASPRLPAPAHARLRGHGARPLSCAGVRAADADPVRRGRARRGVGRDLGGGRPGGRDVRRGARRKGRGRQPAPLRARAARRPAAGGRGLRRGAPGRRRQHAARGAGAVSPSPAIG